MSQRDKVRRSNATLNTTAGRLNLQKLGVAQFDLTDPYHLALTLGWPAFFAGLVLAYLVINLVFAVVYNAVPGCVANLPAHSLLDAFFFSVETLATVGYGAMAPTTTFGHIIATIEIFVGMLFTATMTGLVFVRFSRPQAKIIFAQRMVVMRNGQHPVLMLRLGNGRPHTMTDATARITALLRESRPGEPLMRRSVDLALSRGDLPYFPLTWTLIHKLDEHSPLHGLLTGDASLSDLRMMVSVSARDPSLAAQVHASHTYGHADIAVGHRYVDAVTWDGGDNSVADMRKISDVESEEGPATR